MSRMQTATAFFKACETGKGWKGCARYCTPDATFRAEAKALDSIDNLQGYADWMRDLFDRMPDASYEVKGFAEDPERDTVLAFGVFSGTVGKGAEARNYSTNYVYAMDFAGDRIGHLTKIWNDTY